MTPEETAIVLDRLAIAYNREVPPEALEVWSDLGKDVSAEVAIDAVNNCILVSEFFPTFAQFFAEVASISREKRKEEMLVSYDRPKGPCLLCDGAGWYRTQSHDVVDASTGEKMWSNEQWKPCDECNHLACDQVERWGRERKKALRHYGEREIEALGVAEIESRTIGERVLPKLRALDQVAFVRFAPA